MTFMQVLRNGIFLISTGLVLGPMWGNDCYGQASLAAEDIIDDITISLPGKKETYTVIRDAVRREQWYYIPGKPRLTERDGPKGPEPDFVLLRYQDRDPANPQTLIEGGVLQFGVKLAPSAESVEALKKELGKRVNIPANFRLSALPMKNAEVQIYSSEGALVSNGAFGKGIAPTFASQQMVFEIPLTKIGANFYDALTRKGGVPVAVTFTYTGLTPKVGVSVKVDWDQTFHYYSQNSKFRARAAYYGWFGGSYSEDKTTIRDELIQNHCIKVEAITDESFNISKLDSILQPLLKQINDEIVQGQQPPPQLSPEVAAEPSAGGYFGSVGYSVAMKDVTRVRKGSSTFDLNIRRHEERKTIAMGLVGIGGYPKEVQDSVMMAAPNAPWDSVFVMAPAVGDSPLLGITQIDMQVSIKVNGAQRDSQAIKWTPGGTWTDPTGRSRSSIAFPLLGAVTKADQVMIETISQISYGPEVLQIKRAWQPSSPVATPISLVDVIEINVDDLTFRKIDPTSQLVDVQVALTSGDRKRRATLRPQKVNGAWTTPAPLVWLVERRTGTEVPVVASIVFTLADGTSKQWARNGQDLRLIRPGLDVSILDSDWRQ